MIQQVAFFITVIEVIWDMGVEPNNKLDWRVGDLMQEFWVRHTGAPPHKDNRAKTNGNGGSHCFALYPAEFRPKIESYVRMCKTELARQGTLFGRPGVEIDLIFPS